MWLFLVMQTYHGEHCPMIDGKKSKLVKRFVTNNKSFEFYWSERGKKSNRRFDFSLKKSKKMDCLRGVYGGRSIRRGNGNDRTR